MEENRAITNPESREYDTVFVPTNSDRLGILIVPTSPLFIKGEEEVIKQNGLQPGLCGTLEL